MAKRQLFNPVSVTEEVKANIQDKWSRLLSDEIYNIVGQYIEDSFPEDMRLTKVLYGKEKTAVAETLNYKFTEAFRLAMFRTMSSPRMMLLIKNKMSQSSREYMEAMETKEAAKKTKKQGAKVCRIGRKPKSA